MVKFSKRMEYALTALVHLHQAGPRSLVTSRELSDRYGFPGQHLGKVLQKMVRTGLLDSVQGAHGGYRMSAPLSRWTMGQVMDLLDGPAPASGAKGHETCGEICTCYVHGIMDELQQRVRGCLDQVSLADLLARVGRKDEHRPVLAGRGERA